MSTKNTEKNNSTEDTFMSRHTKWCGKCEKDIPMCDFSFDKSGKYGLTAYCRRCKRDSEMKKVFGVGAEYLESVLWKQKNRCGVCDEVLAEEQFGPKRAFPGKAVIDMDHSTGIPRGVLCQKCHIILSMAESASWEWFRKLSEYLRRYDSHFPELYCGNKTG